MWFKPARIEHAPEPPKGWHSMPHGAWWRDSLARALEPHWETLFGHYLIKLGSLSAKLPNDCRIREQYTVGTFDSADIQARLSALPFQENTVDAVLMAHVLEYAEDPHEILREVDRMLRADGHLILALTNPWSPTILPRLWPSWRESGLMNSRLFSKNRVTDWLDLMHYEVIHDGYFAAGAPIPTVRDPERGWGWLLRSWPRLNGGYYLIARKREWPITPVRLQRARRQSTEIATASARIPSARSAHLVQQRDKMP